MSLLGQTPERFTCSRAGCASTADWRIDWRNPKIHEAGRVKTWLACADHRDFLEGFLAARDFPLTVARLGDERPDDQRQDDEAG